MKGELKVNSKREIILSAGSINKIGFRMSGGKEVYEG